MSGIYFHTPDRPAAVVLHGSERAHIDGLMRRTFREALREQRMAPLRRALGLTGAVPVDGMDPDKLRILGWMYDDDPRLEVRSAGEPLTVGIPGLVANTAITALPACQALIWLHYGCENHGWVDGPDRGWLADRYQQALAAGLAREGMGWDAVIDLLRERDDAPVVTSAYDNFPDFDAVVRSTVWTQAAAPSAGTAEEDEEERLLELWEDLDTAQRWELGLRALRERPADLDELRWSPEIFAGMGIQHDYDADRVLRIDTRPQLVGTDSW